MLAVDRTSASIQFLENWVVIPITSCAMLAYVWGISKLIQIMAPTSSFPASVAGMVILFALLIASMYLFGPKPTNRVVAIITPTTDFLLRWINVLFCPALINVPKTPAVSPLEVGRITAVFVAGFFIFLAAASSIIRVMRMLSPFKSKTKKEQANDEEQAHEIDERMSIAASNHTNPDDRATSTAFELEDMTTNSRSHDDNNHTTISSAMPSETTFESQADDATEASTTRPSPFISRGSSVAILEHPPEAPTASGQASDEPHHPALNSLFIRLQKSVLHLYTNLTINHKIYLVLFLTSLIAFLALPTSSPASPFFSTLVQLTCVVLAYLAALTVPLHIRFFVHPMLTCSAVTLSLIAILEATKNRSLLDGLNEFSSGRKYNVLLAGGGRGAHGEILWPGAGDVLFSFMDASIVSLGVVMFKYRAELKLHFFEMISTILILAVLTLFIYPLMANAIGVSPARSLSLVARSVTTPLAIPLESIIQGDVTLAVCLIIITGISGTIVIPVIMKKILRIKDDDYLSIGVTMGCNSHAIGTAYLLAADPRAAAISSLSFVLFGTVCVILVSIPVVPQLMWGIVGLKVGS